MILVSVEEAAVHEGRLYLSQLQPDHALIKLDFKNAFNSVHMDKMREAVEAIAPSIYKTSKTSPHRAGTRLDISSQQGGRSTTRPGGGVVTIDKRLIIDIPSVGLGMMPPISALVGL